MGSNFLNNSAWAITQHGYDAVSKAHSEYLADAGLLKEAAAWGGDEDDNRGYAVKDGVAIINISGTIHNRMTFFSYLYGGASVSKLREQIKTAEIDPKVKSILFNFDSPGGTVAGVDDLAAYIRAVKKPTTAYAEGRMLSAAMWIGSAADRVVIGKTAEAGSIGVILVHTEYSKADEKYGEKNTIITAGKYKAVGNPYEPLTDDAKGTIQAEIDYIYSLFVETISENRGVSVDKALSMADGKVFIGQQAVDVGLADMVGNYDTAIKEAATMGESRVQYYLKTGKTPERKHAMSFESVKELKEAFPDLAAALVKEGVDSVDTSSGVKAETERILGLAAVQFGEDGDKFKALVESGVSVDQFKAIKAMEQEPEKVAKQTSNVGDEMLDAIHKADAPDPGHGGTADEGPKTFTEAWKAVKEDEKCDTRKAMSMAARQYPELYNTHAKGGK